MQTRIQLPVKDLTAPTETQMAMQFGDWVKGKLRYSNKVIAVSSMGEASDKWCQLRDAANLGASEAPIVVVIDINNGEQLAKVSYNGRVWDTEGKEIDLCAS